MAEWLQSGRKAPKPKRLTTIKKIRDEEGDGVLTITELAIRYYKFAQDYYVKNGRPTTEADGIKMAIRDLRKMYAETLITDFGPSSLKTLREVMISRNLSRTTINKQIRRITRMFRWGVSENLVRPEILTALQSIPGLKAGRSSAREPEKVKPVSEQELDSVRPYLNPVIQAMVEVQRLTGMRPGEIVGLTTQDIDFTEAIWSFRPPSDKTQHFQKERVIYFGPLAQEVIKPWLNTAEPDACIFSPAVAEALRYQKLRATRRTKVQPSQISRAKSKPEKKTWQEVYSKLLPPGN